MLNQYVTGKYGLSLLRAITGCPFSEDGIEGVLRTPRILVDLAGGTSLVRPFIGLSFRMLSPHGNRGFERSDGDHPSRPDHDMWMEAAGGGEGG